MEGQRKLVTRRRRLSTRKEEALSRSDSPILCPSLSGEDVQSPGSVKSAGVVEVVGNVSSVRGSFHQGDRRRFQHAGSQCMAISLVALTQHSVDSVFSWQTENLDKVVVFGDRLYNEITAGSNRGGTHLCVLDLPRVSVIDGQTFEFGYGEYVSGDVDGHSDG